MRQVLSNSWALFLGMFMLMIGNGLQGTLLGLRGAHENFSTFEMSIVMSAYFVGFLFASSMAPEMIRRVGHVRVFAALGSTISAVLILYPIMVTPWAWAIGRIIMGFCFCGVYITAESWLNDAATNETRGTSLSLYMIVQMGGIVVAQMILLTGDIAGYVLFIIPSVLVSLAFAPILLSVSRVPSFGETKRMKLRDVAAASPLASVGMFFLGGVFSAQFGMAAVYGARAGMSVPQISAMVSMIYIAALLLQYPIGWLSDRMDRRILIVALSGIGALGAALSFLVPDTYWLILVSAALVGGMSNPLYALLIAYANDYLEREDMAAASGGLLFINGVGAIIGPLLIGLMMDWYGPGGYWGIIAAMLAALAVYGGWRMTQRTRDASVIADPVSYAPVSASSTPIAAEWAQEVYIDAELESEDEE
ncbi:MAG: MFS transporter [Rhodobacteraceae bacterium]|nr:MFS transporter [Paracoccaceae bacterium]